MDKPTRCRAVMAFCPANVSDGGAAGKSGAGSAKGNPTAAGTKKTLLLMGHLDTVGLEPYKSYSDIAYDSAKLKEVFAGNTDEHIAAHAQSPDWNFGRGWLDMKGGVAAITEVFLHEARRGELPANLVLLLTPDEESASRGLRTLVPELTRLKDEHALEFVRVVNADYISPLFIGDDRKYFYSGVVGKLLLGLSVFGEPTHAGETFDGVNSSTLAGYLAYALEHNRRLMCGTGGEWLPPPTVLHMGDRRTRYDVMTMDYGQVYVNMFHLGEEPRELWRRIVGEVRRVVNRFDREMRLRYNRFSAKANLRLPRYELKPEVIDYAGLLDRVYAAHGNAAAQAELIQAEALKLHADDRERALFVIRRLHGLLPPGRPVVVVSLLPPFYPAQLSPKAGPATDAMKQFCSDHALSHRWVYPYISDMSYFSFGDVKLLEQWHAQSPLWFAAGEVERYSAIAAPVCNLGPWGIGAHTAEERVYVPFLRDELPRLLSEALYRFAG